MTVVVVAMVAVALEATVDLEKEDVVLVKLQTRGKIEPSALGLVYARSF